MGAEFISSNAKGGLFQSHPAPKILAQMQLEVMCYAFKKRVKELVPEVGIEPTRGGSPAGFWV